MAQWQTLFYVCYHEFKKCRIKKRTDEGASPSAHVVEAVRTQTPHQGEVTGGDRRAPGAQTTWTAPGAALSPAAWLGEVSRPPGALRPRPRGADQPHRPGPSRSEGRGASSGSSRENRRARAACVVTWWPQPARGRPPRTDGACAPCRPRHPRPRSPLGSAPPRSPRPLRSDPWRPRARTHVRVPVPAAAAAAVLQQPEPVDRAGRTEPAHCRLPARPAPQAPPLSPASPISPAPRARAAPGDQERGAVHTPHGRDRQPGPASRTARQGLGTRPPRPRGRPPAVRRTGPPGKLPTPPSRCGPSGDCLQEPRALARSGQGAGRARAGSQSRPPSSGNIFSDTGPGLGLEGGDRRGAGPQPGGRSCHPSGTRASSQPHPIASGVPPSPQTAESQVHGHPLPKLLLHQPGSTQCPGG